MGVSGFRRLTRRPGLIVLAFAALLLQAMIPAGYMVGSGQSPALVICTGHGPLASQDHPGGAPTSNHDGACVFAGHGVAVTPPVAARIPARVALTQTPIVVLTVAQSPGRGLAAPPPPSRGPPELS
jgi:hypothetical protein